MLLCYYVKCKSVECNYYTECHFSECPLCYYDVMLTVNLLRIITMLSVILLSVF
jgi:hypothetical protein